MSNLQNYIQKLQTADAKLEIVTDAAACQAYVQKNRSRIAVQAPEAIIYPTSSEQIQMVVKEANENQVPLVVRSSHGTESVQGSSLPAEGKKCIAVNLSKMTKIMHVDTKNKMVLIEAGVTYEQLLDALKPYGFTVEHPLLPRKEKSVIASLLDRDPVMTPKHCWDIPDPLTCVEVVMGNGTLFRTGSAAGPGTLEEMLESGCALNQPQGPYCLDLARVMCGSQGTLGIVVWASVKIRPIGSARQMVYVQADDVDTLTAYTSQVIRRRLGENICIINDELFCTLNHEKISGLKKWILICDVRGYRYFPERYMKDQIADMGDLAKEYGLNLTEKIDGFCNEKIESYIDGVSEKNAFWKDTIGEEKVDIYFQSTMDRLGLFATLAEAAVRRCELDEKKICVYCQLVMMGRSAHMEFLIPVDAQKADELEKMLGTAFLDNRAFFSRPYGALVEQIYEKSTSQTPFMKHIKHFFDENGIMNPGRLVYDGGEK